MLGLISVLTPTNRTCNTVGLLKSEDQHWHYANTPKFLKIQLLDALLVPQNFLTQESATSSYSPLGNEDSKLAKYGDSCTQTREKEITPMMNISKLLNSWKEYLFSIPLYCCKAETRARLEGIVLK